MLISLYQIYSQFYKKQAPFYIGNPKETSVLNMGGSPGDVGEAAEGLENAL